MKGDIPGIIPAIGGAIGPKAGVVGLLGEVLVVPLAVVTVVELLVVDELLAAAELQTVVPQQFQFYSIFTVK